MPDFKTPDERTGYIVQNADYFTAVRFLGVGQYERHERASLVEAIDCAQALANATGKLYGVYAASGPYDAWVRNIHPERKQNDTPGNA